MSEPATPPAQPAQWKIAQFVMGVTIGLATIVPWWYALAIRSPHPDLAVCHDGYLNALLLWMFVVFVAVVSMGAFLAIRRWRFIGYGILAGLIASPVVGAIGCSIIANVSPPKC